MYSCSDKYALKKTKKTRAYRSPAYQVIVKKYSDDNTKGSEKKNHSGVILKPEELSQGTASKAVRNAVSSVSGIKKIFL